MESQTEQARLDGLLEKYWEGETTLQEEAELKKHFEENPSLAPTGLYFRGIAKSAKVESEIRFDRPAGRWLGRKFSIAASIAIGLTVGGIVLQNPASGNDFEIEDPQEAYEIARTALMKMSSGLNQGKTHSEQLQKIKKAEELIKEEQL